MARKKLTPARIRKIRKRLGWSQRELAEDVGVSKVCVYFWEAGRTSPNEDNDELLRALEKSA